MDDGPKASQQAQQRLGHCWFCEVSQNTRLFGTLTLFIVAEPRNGDHKRLFCRTPAQESGRDLPAVNARKFQVKQHDIGWLTVPHLDGCRAIVGDLYLVTIETDKRGQCIGRVGVVFHNKNSKMFVHAQLTNKHERSGTPFLVEEEYSF